MFPPKVLIWLMNLLRLRHSLALATDIAYLKARLADLAKTLANTMVNSQSFLWKKVHFAPKTTKNEQ